MKQEKWRKRKENAFQHRSISHNYQKLFMWLTKPSNQASNQATNQSKPWSTVLLEMLVTSSASQEIPCLLWNPKVHTLCNIL
jgi:hypothetical protein